MERLTIKSTAENGYTLKCMCQFFNGEIFDEDGCKHYCMICDQDCGQCGIQQAFDRLAAYEDIGLTPTEVKTLQEDNARIHKLIDEIEETFDTFVLEIKEHMLNI